MNLHDKQMSASVVKRGVQYTSIYFHTAVLVTIKSGKMLHNLLGKLLDTYKRTWVRVVANFLCKTGFGIVTTLGSLVGYGWDTT
jgi:hypothetical protein